MIDSWHRVGRTLERRSLWGVSLVLTFCALAQPAMAAQVSLAGRGLVVKGDRHENLFEITADTGRIRVTDSGGAPSDSRATSILLRRLTPGTGCRSDGRSAVCPATNITHLRVFAGPGDDSVALNNVRWPARISGGSGDDRVVGGRGSDVIDGGLGTDTLIGARGFDRIRGGAGNDLIHGRSGDDWLIGNGGDDLLHGGGGHDIMDGGLGRDAVSYADRFQSVSVSLDGRSNDGVLNEGDNVLPDVEVLHGGSADDLLTGPPPPVFPELMHPITGVHLQGGRGRDWLVGGTGGDRLDGGDDDDLLDGRGGDDLLFGDSGDDVLHGGPGNDNLLGNVGSDALYGDDDNDSLGNDSGAGLLDGGPGDDLFRLIEGGGERVICGSGFDDIPASIAEGNDVGEDCELALPPPPPPAALASPPAAIDASPPCCSIAVGARRSDAVARIVQPPGRPRYILVRVSTALGAVADDARVRVAVTQFDRRHAELKESTLSVAVNRWVKLKTQVHRNAHSVEAEVRRYQG